jgi:hypothetical protein
MCGRGAVRHVSRNTFVFEFTLSIVYRDDCTQSPVNLYRVGHVAGGCCFGCCPPVCRSVRFRNIYLLSPRSTVNRRDERTVTVPAGGDTYSRYDLCSIPIVAPVYMVLRVARCLAQNLRRLPIARLATPVRLRVAEDGDGLRTCRKGNAATT